MGNVPNIMEKSNLIENQNLDFKGMIQGCNYLGDGNVGYQNLLQCGGKFNFILLYWITTNRIISYILKMLCTI